MMCVVAHDLHITGQLLEFWNGGIWVHRWEEALSPWRPCSGHWLVRGLDMYVCVNTLRF